MAVKPLECPYCHRLIETFDETTKKGFCPFCDALIPDIPSCQHAYEAKASSYSAVATFESADKMLERIDGFILIGNRGRAETLLDEYTDKYPADFRGWNKLLELQADMFETDSWVTNKIIKCANNMIILAKTQEERNCLQKAVETLDGLLDTIADKREAFQVEAQQTKPKVNHGFGDYALGGGCLGCTIGIIVSLAMGSSIIEFGLTGAVIGILICTQFALFDGLKNGVDALKDKDWRQRNLQEKLEWLDNVETIVNTALGIIKSGQSSERQ